MSLTSSIIFLQHPISVNGPNQQLNQMHRQEMPPSDSSEHNYNSLEQNSDFLEHNSDLQFEHSIINQQELEVSPSIFASENIGNKNSQLNETEFKQVSAENLQFKLPNVLSKNILIFVLSFGTFSFFFFLFALVLRKGDNLLIPTAMIFQSMAYFFTPLIFIHKNKKLRNLIINIINSCLKNVQDKFWNTRYILNFNQNQVHPYNVEC